MPILQLGNLRVYSEAAEAKLRDLNYSATTDCFNMIQSTMRGIYGDKTYLHAKLWGSTLRRELELATPYYFAPELTPLLLAGAHQLYDYKLQATDLPGSSGYFWFKKRPLFKINAADEEYADENTIRDGELCAVAWTTTNSANDDQMTAEEVRRSLGCSPEKANILVMTFFVQTGDLTRLGYGREGGQPLAFITWPIGQTPGEALGTVKDKMGIDGKPIVSRSIHEELTFIASCFLFMQQSLISVTRTPLHRDTRKRIEKYRNVIELDTFEPQVVAFRKTKHIDLRVDKPEQKVVQWSCQWLTTGHWRNQPYRNGVVKKIWIAPYVKGPEGKPFKVHEGRIGAVVR